MAVSNNLRIVGDMMGAPKLMKFLTFSHRQAAAGRGSSSGWASKGHLAVSGGCSSGGPCCLRPDLSRCRRCHRESGCCQLELLSIAIVLSQNFFLWFAIILVNGPPLWHFRAQYFIDSFFGPSTKSQYCSQALTKILHVWQYILLISKPLLLCSSFPTFFLH